MKKFFSFLLGYNMDDEYFQAYESVAIWIAVGVLLALFAILVVLSMQKRYAYNVQSIAFAAVCISLSFGLSYVKFFHWVNGGSVTAASFLPICLYAYLFGFKRGLLAGLIYSMLQIIQGPYILNLIQLLLDYVLAFSVVALTAVFARLVRRPAGATRIGAFFRRYDFTIALLGVGLCRFVCSALAGFLYWGAAFPASLAINSVILIDILICMVPAALLQSVPGFWRYIRGLAAKVTARDFAEKSGQLAEVPPPDTGRGGDGSNR